MSALPGSSRINLISQTSWMLVMWIGLPSFMPVVIGGRVPHIYRCARRTAIAQRDETRELPARAPAVAPARHTATTFATRSSLFCKAHK